VPDQPDSPPQPDQPDSPPQSGTRDQGSLDAEHLTYRDEIAAAVLDGSLDPAAQAHLSRCPTCAADLAAYRRVGDLARAAVAAGGIDEMPPQRVWHRIAAAVGYAADPTAFSAILEGVPGQPEARGVAQVRDHDTGRLLTLDASGLPAPAGYYAVWLADPEQRDLVAMGTLGPEHRGVWTIPPGLELSAYPLVMVSAQRYGGVPTPGPVVLRGAFAR
jgi:hypothetical protein